MDKQDNAVEIALQNELILNERIVSHPSIGLIKLVRPTPRKQALVSDYRRKQQHGDIKKRQNGEDIYFHAELEKMGHEFGIWTEEDQEALEEVTSELGSLMGQLDISGFEDGVELLNNFHDSTLRLANFFTEENPAWEAVQEFSKIDGGSLKLKDLIKKHATTTEVDDLLELIDAYRMQFDNLKQMGDQKKKWIELQKKYTNHFKDSIEKRADRAEELATIYYCCVNAETEKPLWPTIEQMLDANEETIVWLSLEYSYFVQGVSEEFRDTAAKYGFLRRGIDTLNSSEDSPEAQAPSFSGESQERTQENSSDYGEELSQ